MPNLNFGSGSPDGTFLPGATVPNVSAMYTNLTANGNATAGGFSITGSFATLGPFCAGADQGNPTLIHGSYDANVDGKPSPATFNASDGETSTEVFLTSVLQVDSAQQGSPAISNVAAITASFAGIAPGELAVNNFSAGSVGTVGNKSS